MRKWPQTLTQKLQNNFEDNNNPITCKIPEAPSPKIKSWLFKFGQL